MDDIASFCKRDMATNLAKELCISLTNSKFAIASPLKAGVKSCVKSLNARRFSPIAMSGILLTIFSKATLAQALLAVHKILAHKPKALDLAQQT